MYRDFGFTPVEDADGTYNKVLVRESACSFRSVLTRRRLEQDPQRADDRARAQEGQLFLRQPAVVDARLAWPTCALYLFAVIYSCQ